MEYDKLKLHFKYCIVILIAAIICIATDRWSDSENFTTYLSNAATMASLLLAVVAIFYSFVSNDSLSRSLGSISTVSTDVREAKDEIRSFVISTKSTHEDTSAISSAMVASSRELHSSLSALDSTLVEISDQNRELRSLLADIPSKIEKLEITVNDATKKMTAAKPQAKESNSQAATGLSNASIDEFMSGASLGGNLLSYAAVLAHKKDKTLVLADVAVASGMPKLASYFNGFLTCMYAIDVLDYKQLDGSRTYKISRINSYLAKKIKNYFLTYIDDFLDSSEAEEWKSRLEKVEKLFVE